MAYQILVVDDEPALRMMVQEILTQAGYAVCLAGSCREALTQRAQVHPDAILLDVMLPKMDGFTVCKKVREKEIEERRIHKTRRKMWTEDF